MLYRYILILLILLLLAGPLLAQESRYRVEILVLRHLEQNEEPKEQLELPDYSMAIDFLTPPPEEEDEALIEEASADAPGAEENGLAENGLAQSDEGVEVPEDPNRLIHLEEMSSVMQEAWRRLRLSGPFRPEQYLSWEQGSQEPFPTLRVHDLQTVMTDDPWAEFRETQMQAEQEFAATAELDAVDVNDGLEGPVLPEPVYYYRLDGTASLRRSRFLHVDLDLQWREPVWQPDLSAVRGTDARDVQPEQPSSFLVFELKQSRQVRSGRMEYFDGPVLGVLAWITEVKGENGESP